MLVPIIPTVALVGFAGFAIKHGVQKQWQNAIICLLCGLLAFSLISQLTKKPKNLKTDQERITALEQRINVLERKTRELEQGH